MNHTFKGIVEFDNENVNLYYHHIKVPVRIYQEYKDAEVQRIVFHLDGNGPHHGAFIPIGDGRHFIIANKPLLKKCKLSVGDEVQVKISPDNSKYGMPICNEMKELLEQDEEGSLLFHKLTDGKIRSLLFHVNKYKSVDKRIEKGLIVLEHLKANNGKLAWKMLNEAFKSGLQL